jgi:type I restriction enzyme M protein
MALKKTQLYSTLWESCNALRGSMDASQYKDYVLMVLFVKYLSDKAKQGGSRLVVPEGCRFEDFVALKQNQDIGEQINKKLEAIKEANVRVIGSLSLPNFNDPSKLGEGRTMVKTLSDLIGVFEREELDFGRNGAADDDLLGDAYEYLMKNFAAESGKSKGQFYTPAEVSRVIAQALDLSDLRSASDVIYDPTCGSGSLLLRALAETPRGNVALRGQEKDGTTASLAKLNILLHGVVNARIEVGDTLNDPKFKTNDRLDVFDVCIANPPFSQKNWLGEAGESDRYHRWSSSLLPPKKCGDYAFLLHLVRSMRDDPGREGRGACILPHGVLFRGHAEREIRKHLVKKRIIAGIVGLPPNLFFGTGIPAAILLLDKRGAASREGIFFIDAKEGFRKDGAKNRLREQDIRRIVDAWRARADIPHYARFVPWAEIEAKDFNLNIPRYVIARDTAPIQDLDGHLRGGISAAELDAFASIWSAFPDLRGRLFAPLREGYFSLVVPPDGLVAVIDGSPSVSALRAKTDSIFAEWRERARPAIAPAPDATPKVVVDALASSILDAFRLHPVLDAYDVYGAFMDYALETLRDDLYLLCAGSWAAAREIEVLKRARGGTVTDFEGAIVPKMLVQRRFLPDALVAAEKAAAATTEAEAALESFLEVDRDKGEDSLFHEPDDDGDGLVPRSDRDIKADPDIPATDKAAFFARKKALKDAKDAQKTADKSLLDATIARYAALSEDECRTLVLDDKWFATLERSVLSLYDARIQDFVSSLRALHDRYKDTLPALEAAAERTKADVHKVLHSLGFNWEES